MRILVFGDSITQGYFDTKLGGWANQLAIHYQKEILKNLEGDWAEVFNLGVSGDTAAGVLSRIEYEVKARRLGDDNEELLVLAVGTNDAILRNNRPVQDEYQFEEIFDSLLGKATDITSRVLVVGLIAVDESMTNPWKYSSTGMQWLNNRLNLFEDIIKQSTTRANLPFVPVHDKFLTRLRVGDKLLADGLHPNDEGHKLIADLVRPELEALLG